MSTNTQHSVALQYARRNAHIYFDTIWMSTGRRKEAYKWLGVMLNRRPYKCHMGSMSLAQCEEVILLCKPIARQLWSDDKRLRPDLRWRKT